MMIKALRLPNSSISNEATMEKYLKMVADNFDVVDEITIFVGGSHHGYTPREKTLAEAALVTHAIKKYKELGVKKVGLNVLATLGHTEDGGGILEKAEMQYMVNFEGIESGSCLCPADERFIEYIKDKYTLYAKSGADHVWLDDDVRVGNHGVVQGFCYCPVCIAKYNKRYGKNYSLADIQVKWDTDTELRETWKEDQYDSLCNMINEIHDALKAVDPKLEIGYMSGGGNCVYEWIDASEATKGRPGGGFFNDRFTLELFQKSFWIQKELAEYPDRVTDIQYEYESYNGRTLEKSFHTSEMETSISIMMGCNGVLYNRSTMILEPKFFEMLRKSKDKWNVLTNANRGCMNMGVFCASAETGSHMSEISIPVTANLDTATCAIVLGEQWNQYTDDMVEKILSKNVITDGKGIAVLNKRGFRDKTCGEVEKTFHNGVVEYFHDNPLNGEFSGKIRYASMDIFYEGDAYLLNPDSDAEVVTSLKTNVKTETTDHGPAMIKKEFNDGRKFIADGYLMPRQAQTASKRTQMINIFRWLSEDTLPVVIEKSIKVVPYARGKNGMVENVMLCNAHFDPTEKFEVEIISDKDFCFIEKDGSLIPAKQRHENGRTFVTVDNIERWDYVLLTSYME